MTTLDDVRTYALAKPHTSEDLPFGPNTLALRAATKMFALVALDEHPLRMNLTSPPALDDLLTEAFESRSAFDALNRPVVLTYPKDVASQTPKEIRPEYNRAGALQRVVMDGTPYVEHIAYNAKGQRLLVACGNTLMTRYAYDPQTFRLTRQRTEKFTRNGPAFQPNGNLQQNYTYTYDLVGNILKINDLTPGSGPGQGNHSNKLVRDFEYDPIYRLIRATGRETSTYDIPTPDFITNAPYTPGSTASKNTQAYTQRYHYDRMGNLEKLHHNAFGNTFARNFAYGTGEDNRLEKITIGSTEYEFEYDANGNRTAYANKRYYYDAADQLIAYQLLDGSNNVVTQAHYLYAGGERVKKVVVDVASGETEVTVYIDGVFEWRKNRNGDVQNRLHVLDGASRIAQRRIGAAFADELPNDIIYNLEDHLNNSTHTVSDTGAFLSKEEYYPFGETSYGSYSKKRYRFNGKELDSESGLYYYGMRYYSPWTCRFINVDPIALDYPFYTPYQYAGNEPIANMDLDGLEPEGGGGQGSGDDGAMESNTVIPPITIEGDGSSGVAPITLPPVDAEQDVTGVNIYIQPDDLSNVTLAPNLQYIDVPGASTFSLPPVAPSPVAPSPFAPSPPSGPGVPGPGIKPPSTTIRPTPAPVAPPSITPKVVGLGAFLFFLLMPNSAGQGSARISTPSLQPPEPTDPPNIDSLFKIVGEIRNNTSMSAGIGVPYPPGWDEFADEEKLEWFEQQDYMSLSPEQKSEYNDLIKRLKPITESIPADQKRVVPDELLEMTINDLMRIKSEAKRDKSINVSKVNRALKIAKDNLPGAKNRLKNK